MGYKTVDKQLIKKESAVSEIIRKWKKHQFTINLLRFGAPRKVSQHGVNLMMRKGQQPRTTWQELVDDPKAAETTVTKITISNTLCCSGLKSRSPY